MTKRKRPTVLLLVHGVKTCQVQVVSDFGKTPKVPVLPWRNARFRTSACKSRVKQWKNRMETIPIGICTWNIIHDTPWSQKPHGHLKAVFLVTCSFNSECVWWTLVFCYLIHPYPALWLGLVPSRSLPATVDISHVQFYLVWTQFWICHEADIYNHAAIDGDFEGAQMDIYGNPLGSCFDLARDGAFEGFKILVLLPGFQEKLPDDLQALTVPELSRKGFAVKICTTVDDFTQEMRQHLYHVAWIISGKSFEGDQTAFLSEVQKFHEEGRGLMLWGDNDPWFVHANIVLRKLFGFQLEGNTPGGKELQPGDPLKPGFFGGHPKVCAGILKLHEGLGAKHVKTCLADLQMDFQYLFVICLQKSAETLQTLPGITLCYPNRVPHGWKVFGTSSNEKPLLLAKEASSERPGACWQHTWVQWIHVISC